jgi:hypothetical protein
MAFCQVCEILSFTQTNGIIDAKPTVPSKQWLR